MSNNFDKFGAIDFSPDQIQPPRAADKSLTIIKARSLMVFSKTIGALTAAIAIATQFNLLSFVPKEWEKPVSAGVVLVGVSAMALGDHKNGKAIINERLSKKDLYTPSGLPGQDRRDAMYTAFLTGAQKLVVEQALTGQLMSPSVVEEQVQAKVGDRIAEIERVADAAKAPVPVAAMPVATIEKVRVLEENWVPPV